MAVIKCKMCGGDLNLMEGQAVAQCEYCGSTQTVPTADNEKKLSLFARANRLRSACEFDKAAGVYETIVADFPEEAEAYWGLVLCKYGIEYVDDPGTGKKIPTCHRSSFDSLMEDSDYDQTLENADPIARKVYREEAKQIEELRKGIIAVSANEQPYDIFICYKESDDQSQRTLDSVLAQDLYDALTQKEYRVFFSRITLEDKLGLEYEPYIFAALNSAKVMLAVGTDYEYYNAVWVKNEWSRFLKLMAKDKSKHLIPCYKGIDAYDMPKEFTKLQAQDLGKVGAIQDLLRGIEKLMPRQTAAPVETVVVQQTGGTNITALLDRGNMALEDGEWTKANEYFDQALNIDARCGDAHLGQFLASNRLATIEQFAQARLKQHSAMPCETKHTIPAKDDYILSVAGRCSIFGHLNKSAITELFVKFDRTYVTRQEKLREALEAERKFLSTGSMLQRTRQFLTGTKRTQFDAAITHIQTSLEDDLKKAVSQDEKALKDIQQAYDAFLQKTTEEAETLREVRLNKLEQQYNQALAKEQMAKTFEDFSIAAARYKDLHGYKDSLTRYKDCLAKACAMDRQMEASRKTKKTIRIVLLAVLLLAMVIGIVCCSNAQNDQVQKETVQKLIGRTYSGTYVYNGQYSSDYRSTDDITVTFLDATTCTVYVIDTTTSNGKTTTYESKETTTYTVTVSAGTVYVTWDSLGPVDPFVFEDTSMFTENWNSRVGVALKQQ